MSSFLLSEELGDQRVGLIIPLVSYDRFGHQDSLEPGKKISQCWFMWTPQKTFGPQSKVVDVLLQCTWWPDTWTAGCHQAMCKSHQGPPTFVGQGRANATPCSCTTCCSSGPVVKEVVKVWDHSRMPEEKAPPGQDRQSIGGIKNYWGFLCWRTYWFKRTSTAAVRLAKISSE